MKAQNFIPFSRAKAMEMVTRRMPGVHRRGFVAYKTDGSTTIEELTEQVKGFRDENKGLVKEATDAKAEVLRITKEYEAKVEGINKSLGEKDATIGQIQKEVLELQAKAGRNALGVQGNAPTTVQDMINKSFGENAEVISKASAASPVSLVTDKMGVQTQWKAKAAGTITLANSVTGASFVGVPTFSNEIATRGYDETHFRDIFPVFDSATGSYAFYRSNTPTGDGSVTKQTTHGAAKSQVDKDLTLIPVNADYIAGYADVAKQALTDIPMLQSFLSEELINDYLDTETFLFWSELLGQSTGPTPAAGANAIETAIKTIAALRQIKRRANFIAARPALWANIMITKPNDYSIPNSVIITPQGTVAIVGLPLYVTATNALSDTKMVIGDSRQAGIMQVTGEGLKLELFKNHDKAVYNNLLTWRVEARVALVQRRLEAFSHVTA